jgi:hypothetical protein
MAFPFPSPFVAYCPYCEEKISSVMTILGGADLDRALENDEDVEVIHMTSGQGDHKWRLIREEKATLKKWRAESRAQAG